MVQMSKVAKTREAWISAGRHRCTHDRIDREYYPGGDTGDYACLDCGISWPRSGGQATARTQGNRPAV